MKSGLRLLISHFWDINFMKSFYFNIKAFGFMRGMKLPVIVGYNVKLFRMGKICLTDELSTGMVSLGVITYPSMDENTILKFDNSGIIYLAKDIKIHPGAKIRVGRSGTLTLKGRNTIGSNSRLVCWKEVEIGYNSGCSWDCQIFDTDFHFLYDMEAKRPLKRTASVVIGNDVFIGNHCNIGKGTKISDGCVISSWTKLSGNFSKKGTNLLFAGNPGKVVGENYSMTHAWDRELEKEYSKKLENYRKEN